LYKKFSNRAYLAKNWLFKTSITKAGLPSRAAFFFGVRRARRHSKRPDAITLQRAYCL
jgi:hypothetical protein